MLKSLMVILFLFLLTGCLEVESYSAFSYHPLTYPYEQKFDTSLYGMWKGYDKKNKIDLLLHIGKAVQSNYAKFYFLYFDDKEIIHFSYAGYISQLGENSHFINLIDTEYGQYLYVQYSKEDNKLILKFVDDRILEKKAHDDKIRMDGAILADTQDRLRYFINKYKDEIFINIIEFTRIK